MPVNKAVRGGGPMSTRTHTKCPQPSPHANLLLQEAELIAQNVNIESKVCVITELLGFLFFVLP